jgi:hypothetical protein
MCKFSTLTQRKGCGVGLYPFLVHMGLSVFPAFSHLDWFLHFSQALGASAFLRCHGADLCYGTATNPLYVLEPLTAIREMGCRDPVFSYFLLRGDKEGSWWESGVQTRGGVQMSTVVRVGAE